jgi:hypothetical protein
MARRGRHGQHSLRLANGATAPSRAEVSFDMLSFDMLAPDLEATNLISAEPKDGPNAGLCRHAGALHLAEKGR